MKTCLSLNRKSKYRLSLRKLYGSNSEDDIEDIDDNDMPDENDNDQYMNE